MCKDVGALLFQWVADVVAYAGFMGVEALGVVVGWIWMVWLYWVRMVV